MIWFLLFMGSLVGGLIWWNRKAELYYRKRYQDDVHGARDV